MRKTRVTYSLLALIACLAVAKTAHADDPREQQAEPLYRDGVKLHDKGQEAEALEKFRQSYGIYPSPVALNAIARSELLLGRELEAVRHFRQVLANPLTHPQTAQKARENIQELEARLGRLVVHAPEGTVFLIDGERYVAPVAAPIDVKPGEIRIEGNYGDARYEGRATAVKGATVSLELKRVMPPPSIVEPPTESPPSGDTFWTTGHTLGAAVVGVGVLAIGGGIAFALSASKDQEKIDALLPLTVNGTACATGTTFPQCSDLQSKRDAHDTHASLATGLLVGGGIAAAAGAILFFVWPKSSVSRTGAMILPMAAQHATGIELRQSF